MESLLREFTEIPILENEKNQWSYGSIDESANNSKINPFKIQNRQLTYPKAVIFVLLSKFFEAFAANGLRSKLYNNHRIFFSFGFKPYHGSCF